MKALLLSCSRVAPGPGLASHLGVEAEEVDAGEAGGRTAVSRGLGRKQGERTDGAERPVWKYSFMQGKSYRVLCSREGYSTSSYSL